MKRTFIALLASTLLMLIYTPSIQASEKNIDQDKVVNHPADSGEQPPAPNLYDIDAEDFKGAGDMEAQEEYLISDDFNKEALGSVTGQLTSVEQTLSPHSRQPDDFQKHEGATEYHQLEEKPAEAVAEKQMVEKQASDGTRSKNSSLLNLQLSGLAKPLTGDAKLSLLGYSKGKDEGTSRLLDIEMNDSPLLGTLKVNILGSEKKTTDTGHQAKRGLVAVELDNQLLGKTNINVLESQDENTDTYRSLRSSLATVNVENPLIGKVNAEVATHDAYKSEDLSYRKGGLVSIELEETLVGNVNVDVMKGDGKKTDILNVVTKDTPILGNTDIRVGIDKPSFTATDPKIPEKSTKKPQEPLDTERLEETSEHGVVPEKSVETPRHQVDSKQAMESEDSDEFPPLDFLDIKGADQDRIPLDLNEFMEEQILSDKPVDDSLVAAIQKLLEAGNKQVLNNPAMTRAQTAAINPAEDESRPIENLYVSKAVMLVPSLSGTGVSSSHTNSSANTGLGDLFAGKLDAISYIASEMSHNALFKVKTLRTKWNKEPPMDPPKQSFFLS